ncbi:MAG: hypothetical protein A2117_01270, partial [Candidatus Wildermuthbacteria bacterium GWA2_46_15]
MKNLKKLSSFLSIYLTLSVVLGNFSLPALAVEKNDVNFERVRTETPLDSGGTAFNKINSSLKEVKSLSSDSSITKKERIGLEKSQQAEGKKKDYVEGEILVKYKNNRINLGTISGRATALNFIRSKSLEKKEDLRKINTSVLRIKDAKTVEQKITELKNDPNIEYVEPNYKRYPANINTNDTNKALLWGLDNTGQTVGGTYSVHTGSTDKDIDAPEAWEISEATTSAPVIVAVIDSGVAYNHPDLAANMWDGTNCKDENGVTIAGGCNRGYDYEDGDNIPLPTTSSHGTHIAGTIAAAKGNGRGIIGVAPQVKIMAIKFGLDVASGIKAIDFAIQNGAKIINASFEAASFSQSEFDAINRFKAAGGIFVAAAGNGGTDNISVDNELSHRYPSDYNLDNIISVAATDQNDSLATFSNYGVTSVDVGAPGTNIYSTVPQETTVLFENFEGVTPPAVPAYLSPTGDWGTYPLDSGTVWGKVLYGDAKNIPYAQTANSTITSPAYNLSASGANIDFRTKCDTEYNTTSWTDYMALEFSNDNGSTFAEILKWDEPSIDSNTNPSGSAAYYFENLSIPSQYSTSNFKFRFRWVANGNANTGGGDGCLVDDIKITKFSDGSDEQYGYMNGTSMAAPYVAGLAGLIWGYKPGLTYSQVKDTILNTGDDKASLSGKTVTGKRINAYNALAELNPNIITEDTTWTLANSPYSINEDLQIAQDATLTIEAGVIVKVDSGKKIKVVGNLNTNGSVSSPVKFTSNGASKWWGVEFIDSPNSGINNTIIENATRAIDLKGISLVNFTGNIFRDNEWVVTDINGYQNMQFLNNTFSDNGDVFYGIRTLGDENKFKNNIFIDNNNVFSHGYYFGHTAITNNNFLNNNFIIKAPENGYGYGTVDISNNWWGTTDTSIIDSYIEDGNDDVSLQILNYNPIKNSEISNIGSPSSAKAITAFSFAEETGLINETDYTIVVTVPFGTNVTALVPTITITGASVSPASGEAQDFTSPVTYTVTAMDSSTQVYVVTVGIAANPDIAAVATDKAALVDTSIQGANADLSHVIVALANPLPPLGASGSTTTWLSSNPTVVSSNGQTINRPAFASGDVVVTLTATLTKGVASDTKVFTLTVLKLPASTVATITSATYTVSLGGTTTETITNVSFGTTKATFLAALVKGEIHQTWIDAGIADTVVTGNTLAVTAQDGTTVVTYMVTVNADIPQAPYQVINLGPGWNIVSTPRVLSSHEFSVAETSNNLGIYLLNPNSISGWQTMQEAGQSEFQPLFAYFINNKTNQVQTLKLKYDFNLSPGQRLFQRILNGGWNAIGVASPDYALQKGAANIDTNNISKILSSAVNSVSQVIDFTADQSSLDSVKIGDTWSVKVASEANNLNDFRELKGYGVFVTETTDDYHGSQNINDGFRFSISGTNPNTINAGSENQTLFNFQVDSLYDVNINSLTFSHSGTGDKNNISNLRLYDADSNALLGSATSINENNKIIFSSLTASFFSGTKRIKLVADVNSTAVGGRTHEFTLENATLNHNIIITGLPISNTLTVNAITAAGTLSVSLDSAQNPATQSYVVGTNNRLMTALKFSTGSSEGVKLTEIKLTLAGTNATATDIANITLWDGSTQVGGYGSVIGSTVKFGTNTIGWDSTGLFDVPASTNKTILVKADIPNGANTTHTISLSVANAADVKADGLVSQYDLLSSSVTGTATGNAHTIVAKGTLVISLASTTPAAQTYIKGAIAKGFTKINFTAGTGEDILISAITVKAYRGLGTGTATSSGDVTNVKALKDDGAQFGSTLASPGSAASFSGSLLIPAGNTATLTVVADIPTTTALGSAGVHFDVLAATVATDVTSTGVYSTADVTETGGATGNLMVVGTGSLTVSIASSPADQTAILNASGVTYAGFVLTAGSAEDVRVSSVKLTRTSSGTGADADLSNLALYNDAGTRLTAYKSLASAIVTFSASDFLNSLGIDIAKGQQTLIYVKADVPSGATSGHINALGIDVAGSVVVTGLTSNTNPTATLSPTTGVNYAVTGTGEYEVTLSSGGSLTLAINPDTPITASQAVGVQDVNGKAGVSFTKLLFTAVNEAVNLKSFLVIRGVGAAGSDSDFTAIKLYDGTTLVASGYLSGGTVEFNLTADKYVSVPKNGTKVLTLVGDLAGVGTAGGASTGDDPKLGIQAGVTTGNWTGSSPSYSGKYNVAAEGADSKAAITATGGSALYGNVQIVRQSVPTLAAGTLPSTLLSSGTKTLYKWTVSADPVAAVGWGAMVFRFTGSIHVDSTTVRTIGTDDTTTVRVDGVYMIVSGNGNADTKLIDEATMKVYNSATNTQVAGAWYFRTDTNANAGTNAVFVPTAEEVVAAGTTNTYELRGDLEYGGFTGDAVLVNVPDLATAVVTGTLAGVFGTNA